MYGLRSLACVLGITLWHGVRASLGALLGIADRRGGLYDREPRDWARHVVSATGLEVEAVGLERLDPGRPYVFVVNHASFADIWVLLAYLPGSLRFIAKQELFSIPVLGRALRATGQIALDRGDLEAATQSYQHAARAVRGGRSAIVFAEGTRSRDGRLREFKKGAFVLAIIAGVPLVPVYLRGAHRVLPRGSLWLRQGSVNLVVGEPIATEGLTYAGRDALLLHTHRWFELQQAAVDAVESQA